jgi:hypothetical protein
MVMRVKIIDKKNTEQLFSVSSHQQPEVPPVVPFKNKIQYYQPKQSLITLYYLSIANKSLLYIAHTDISSWGASPSDTNNIPGAFELLLIPLHLVMKHLLPVILKFCCIVGFKKHRKFVNLCLFDSSSSDM